ncbi:hypothetical protein JW916_07090 [Candidatus Sumerlaeota bacterium]|nr:hypothetical protein [Candidatus Sumerlaeota bacterium]
MKRPSRDSTGRLTPSSDPSPGQDLADRAIRRKVDLLEARLRPLEPFAKFSVTRFVENLPGFARLMRLLAQSAVDICHMLVLRHTPAKPRSTYDVFDVCEQYGIISGEVLQPLLRQFVLIENGLDLDDADEVLRIHRELPQTVRAFRGFLRRCREYCP